MTPLPSQEGPRASCLMGLPRTSDFVVNEYLMRVRVTKGVENALIGALLIAAIAWGFFYNHVLEDNPQPTQLQPFAQIYR
jgi:hypothetical protein